MLKIRLTEQKERKHGETDENKLQKYLDEFQTAVNDDLNTTVALSIMWKTLDAEELSDADKIELMKKYDKVLGLDLFRIEKQNIPAEITELAEKRIRARKENNWAESDKIRDQILTKGYSIKDSQNGYEISKK
jgi:cysteinyl-tRNA synthetase